VTISTAAYCTREDVQVALDVASTARSSAQIDRIIEGQSRSIDGQMRRVFYLTTATRKFDWPDLTGTSAYPWRLWLHQNEVISVTTLTSGGTVIPSSGYLLEPVNDGPPYDRIDINLGTTSSFSSGATWQQSISVLGQFGGCPANTAPAGALAAAIASTSATTCDVTDGSALGVGSTLVIESERLLVTGRTMLTTGQTLQSPDLTADDANASVNVTDGTKYLAGEVILVDSERMLIVDVVANVLTVKRAWDGSVLAAHTAGATIYAARRLTVTRGAFGTTAATHLISTAVATHVVPSLIHSLAVAESVSELLNEESGMARTIGSGDYARTPSMSALRDLRAQARSTHARQLRMRTV
jgi:hypothetical protein